MWVEMELLGRGEDEPEPHSDAKSVADVGSEWRRLRRSSDDCAVEKGAGAAGAGLDGAGMTANGVGRRAACAGWLGWAGGATCVRLRASRGCCCCWWCCGRWTRGAAGDGGAQRDAGSRWCWCWPATWPCMHTD